MNGITMKRSKNGSTVPSTFPAWLPFAIIAAVVLCASLWFLWPAPLEFPMDDAYIHFVYAQNLAETGKLIFNIPAENGLGTTSLVWVLLLAIGYKLGISFHLAAKVLGIVSLIVVGIGLFELLRFRWRPLPALVCALLVSLSGHMLWFALSGMETVLFLALGVLVLLAYREEKWLWLGILLGLLTLTRPEGLALALVIGLVEVWRHKGLSRGIVVAALVTLLICGPWFAYLFWRTGHFIPTSGLGKRLGVDTGLRVITGRNEYIAVLGQFPALIYPFVWIIYLLDFTLGGMALPAPRIPVGALLGNPEYSYSIWALILLAGVVAPLLWASARRLGRPRKWNDWIAEKNRRSILTFILWVLLHNLVYMLVLPIPGTASRYGAVNHVALWLALMVGFLSFTQRPRLRLWLAGGLGILALANTVYWNGVYDANIDHMQNVRIAAAHFVAQEIPADEACAAYDIGALRYFSRRPIIDMGGLIDPELGRVFLAGEMDQYLVERDVSCLIFPGRVGRMEDGWFDYAEGFGISSSSLFVMREIISFEIDHRRWLQGYLPTNNYQATVTIYHLER